MNSEKENYKVRIIPGNFSYGLVLFGKTYDTTTILVTVLITMVGALLTYEMTFNVLKLNLGWTCGATLACSAFCGFASLEGIADENLISYLKTLILFLKNRRIMTADSSSAKTDDGISKNKKEKRLLSIQFPFEVRK